MGIALAFMIILVQGQRLPIPLPAPPQSEQEPSFSLTFEKPFPPADSRSTVKTISLISFAVSRMETAGWFKTLTMI